LTALYNITNKNLSTQAAARRAVHYGCGVSSPTEADDPAPERRLRRRKMSSIVTGR